MSQENKVSLELIEKEFNSTRKYHTGHLKTGEEIRFYNKFSETKIKKLMNELYEMTKEDEKQMVKVFQADGMLFDFAYFLIIKYFTDLGKEFPDGYENNIRVFSKLIELDMFGDIVGNILPIEEVGKVIERMMERIKISEQAIRLEEEIKNRQKR